VSDMKPRFQHDCDACTFMGQHGIFDVYLCLSGGGISRSIIARRSSRGDDYASCAVDVFRSCYMERGHVVGEDWFEAFLWGLNNGIAKGLLERDDVYGKGGSPQVLAPWLMRAIEVEELNAYTELTRLKAHNEKLTTLIGDTQDFLKHLISGKSQYYYRDKLMANGMRHAEELDERIKEMMK